MLKTVVLLNIFCGNHDTYFSGFFDELKIQKDNIYLQYKKKNPNIWSVV